MRPRITGAVGSCTHWQGREGRKRGRREKNERKKEKRVVSWLCHLSFKEKRKYLGKTKSLKGQIKVVDM